MYLFYIMTDFDILNYSVEELINIIGLGGEIPLANEQIEEKIDIPDLTNLSNLPPLPPGKMDFSFKN